MRAQDTEVLAHGQGQAEAEVPTDPYLVNTNVPSGFLMCSQLGLPDFTNKNTGRPVQLEFQQALLSEGLCQVLQGGLVYSMLLSFLGRKEALCFPHKSIALGGSQD